MSNDPLTEAAIPYFARVRQALAGKNASIANLQSHGALPIGVDPNAATRMAAEAQTLGVMPVGSSSVVPPPANAPAKPDPAASSGSYEDWAANSGITRSADVPPEGSPMTAPTIPGGDSAPSGGAAPGPTIAIARGGGAVPAHERSLLGPTQWAALEAGNQAQEQAIGAIAMNNASQQQSDEEVHLEHARQARMREDAANSAALEREEELNRRAADFDRMAKQLSQERIDPDRFWASRSTPQKIAAFISIGLGGFVQGARGGNNVGLDMLNTAVERDIRAQEFAYKAKRDSLEAQSTAFGMAMQRYQSVDAARAFARVAAMDAVTAELQRQAAKAKGTEAANRALGAIAELQQHRAEQIVKGIQYVPTQYAEPRYRIAGRFGTFTEKEIKAIQAQEVGHEFDLEKIGYKERVEGEMKQRAQGADEAKNISAQLSREGVPKARASAESAREALVKAPIGTGERLAPKVPGLGILADNPVVHKSLFGKDAAEREQAWLAFKNDALHTLSGAAISPSELPRLNRQFEGANDTASRLKAIQDFERTIDESERNAMAGASPAGQRQYRENKAAARTSGPTPLTGIKSFQPSGGK